MSDPNFEMSLSEFLGQWGFTMDDARNVAERLGIFNLEELKNLGDDFFYHVNNYHEEQRSLKQEADDEFKWSEEDRIKRGISTDDYYKLNESKANETLKEDILNFIKIQGEMPAYSSMLRGLGIDIEESEVTRIIQELKAEGRIDTGFQNRTSQNYPEERSPWVKGGGHNYDSGEWTWKNNESKASEGIYEEYVNKFGDNQSLGGGFGDALRANDLELAFSRADTDNYNKLKELGYAWTGNESKASEFTPLELYETIEPLWNNLSENDRKKIIINTTNGFVGQDNNIKSNWDQIDHMTQQRIADNWDNAFNMIDEDKKTIYGLESYASEYSIKEEFDLQDQDGKYEMLSKADLSVTDATNYSTYSYSELPEEVKDSLKGDEDSFGESWSRKSSIDKIEALERLGIKQGDAIKLSGVEFEDFGEDLQGALKGDVEDARNRMKAQKAFLNKTEDDQNPTGFNNQVGGEVDNPNSEFGQNYPDYNKIGESQTSMTKYECEHCNLGFKSNESLSRHHKSIHKIASEDIDGYSVDAGFTGQNSFTDMSSISKEDVTQEWWNNVATPSSKARILNNTGTPVENTFGLPSYYELTQETKAYLLGLDDFSFESKASEFMTELEQMKHGAWNDDFDFNQSKLYVSTPAQKRQYQMQGIPTESNGEPKYSELYDDDLYAVQEIQESPIPDQVDVYDHDTFLPVKYDEIVPNDFSYRPSTWGESKANESDTFLPRSDPLFSDEEIVGGIRKHYDTVDYYQDDRPDFNNDPDFEGNVNGINVEPSQYIQSGMDHTDYGRGDIDESKANEDLGETEYDMFDEYVNSPTQGYMVCKICKQKVDNVFYDDIGDKIDFSSTRWNHLDKQHGINNFDDIRRYVVSNEWIFESKASEGQFDPNVADLWDESDMSERLKILSSSGITGDFDMAINGWSNLPLDVQITLEEINVAELRGESLAKENKTYTCDKCGKVGDSFTDMAQEECPADAPNNHQIPIFGDQVKPRGIGEEHYSMHFDQAYSDMNDENPITGLKQCEYCDAQFGEYDKQGMIDHANSHDADLDPVTGDSKESKASEGQWTDQAEYEKTQWINAKDSALMGDFEPFINLVKQFGGDWQYATIANKEEILQQIEGELENLRVSMVDRRNWDALGMHQESKASEGSEDVYNYEYVDDKVVCKNCGMKFDNAIDDARAMKDHSEIHESLYDKEAYAHEDDLDTLMWDNENPDDKGKQWKDKKGKKQESKASEDYWADDPVLDKHFTRRTDEDGVQMTVCNICGQGFDFDDSSMIHHVSKWHPEVEESKASESILAGRSIEEYLQEYGMTREEGEQVAEYAGMDLKELIEIGNFDEARHHRVQDMDVSYMYEESKASEDITFADQHRGIQKDMIEFIRRRGGSASELDIDREFDLLNNFDNESRHLQALVNDGTLTMGGWQPDNSGNDGYTDGSYLYNLNESLASEAGLDDHSCPECGFITSDNSDYVDHLNAHED